MREHKFVIVRTRRGSVVDCYSFMTPDYNKGNTLPTLMSPNKVADEIDLLHFVGGKLVVRLKTKRTNGEKDYTVTEDVHFEEGIVTGVEIYTEFVSARGGKS